MPLEVKITAKDEASKKIQDVRENVRQSMNKVAEANENAAKKYGQHGKAVSGLSMNVGDLVKKLATMNVGILAATGGFGILAKKFMGAVNMTADYRDNLAKLEKNLSISRELITNFGHAAELSGSSQEAATSSLTKFSKAVKQGIQGSEEMVTTFNNLGVSLKNADGSARRIEDIFMDVVSQMKKVNNETDRSAYLFDLFGRTGVELNETLKMLGTNYDSLNERTKSLGLQFSDEERERAEKYKDTVFEMKEAFRGLGMEIGEKALPALTKFMEEVTSYFAGSPAPDAAPGSWKAKYAEEISKKNQSLEEDPEIRALREKLGLVKKIKQEDSGKTPVGYGENRETETAAEAGLDTPNEVWAPGQWAFAKRRQEKLDQFKLEGEQSEQRKKEAEEVAKKKAEYETWANSVIEAANDDITKQYEQWNDRLEGIANTLSSQVSNAMVQLIEQTDNAAEVFRKLGQSILTSVVGSLAQAVTKAAMLWGMKKLFGSEPREGFVGDVLGFLSPYHKGGIIGAPRTMHGGGSLAPDEVYAKLKVGEGVIPAESMRALGKYGFENVRRGRTNNTVNVTVNAESFDEHFVRFKLDPTMKRLQRRRVA
jgi:hypothetical protein